jgi:hypothetical protein
MREKEGPCCLLEIEFQSCYCERATISGLCLCKALLVVEGFIASQGLLSRCKAPSGRKLAKESQKDPSSCKSGFRAALLEASFKTQS